MNIPQLFKLSRENLTLGVTHKPLAPTFLATDLAIKVGGYDRIQQI